MSLSFVESLERAKIKQNYSDYPVVVDNSSVFMTNDNSPVEEEWTPIDTKGYEFYTDYNDDKISYIDEDKNITLHPKQINITQETNSQYIPFEMPRYYDGFDLINTTLKIYYINKHREYGFDSPVNVYYSQTKIKFAWLVDNKVTAVDGNVKFEIQASGVNSKNEPYLWKTKPNEEINIIKSLQGANPIKPDETWIEDFSVSIADVRAKVDVLEKNVSELQESVEEITSITEMTAEEIDLLMES